MKNAEVSGEWWPSRISYRVILQRRFFLGPLTTHHPPLTKLKNPASWRSDAGLLREFGERLVTPRPRTCSGTSLGEVTDSAKDQASSLPAPSHAALG